MGRDGRRKNFLSLHFTLHGKKSRGGHWRFNRLGGWRGRFGEESLNLEVRVGRKFLNGVIGIVISSSRLEGNIQFCMDDFI